eukprot:gene31430-40824_t
MDEAARNGMDETVTQLLNRGAKIEATDNVRSMRRQAMVCMPPSNYSCIRGPRSKRQTMMDGPHSTMLPTGITMDPSGYGGEDRPCKLPSYSPDQAL